MKYSDLKNRIEKIRAENGLKNGIKLDKATTIFDAEKFVESHITYLDHEERKKKRGERVCSRQVNPHFERILKYLEELDKIKNTKKN